MIHFTVWSVDEEGDLVARNYWADDADHAREQHQECIPEEQFHHVEIARQDY